MSNVKSCAYGWLDSDTMQVLNVSTFGAVGNGTNDDTIAIQAAIDSAATTISGGAGGAVFLPKGTYLISAQLKLKNKVRLVGAGAQATVIKAASGFPVSTPIIRIGDGTGAVFFCRLESLQLNCNDVSGSTGIYSTEANEQCGVYDCHINGVHTKGIDFDTGCGAIQEIHMVQIYGGSATAATAIGVRLGSATSMTLINHATINGFTALPFLHSVHVVNQRAHITGLHCEEAGSGVTFDTTGTGTVRGLTAHVGSATVTNCVQIVAGNGGNVTLMDITKNAATNTILDSLTGNTITAPVVEFYSVSDGTTGNQVIMSDGATGTVGNVTGASLPVWRVKSTATSLGASRSAIDIQDGNGDGWRIRQDGTATSDPLQFFAITTGTAGASPTLELLDNGVLEIFDAITAPAGGTTSRLGFYVDNSGGDLKCVFADGVKKTITVDTTGAGTFTVTAASITTVSDDRSSAVSQISFSPLNAAAGLLVRTKTCYVDSVAVGAFNFNVSATGAGAPSGSETFQYTIEPS